jgi:5-formyltetrahydrofolate cyclo-ligase
VRAGLDLPSLSDQVVSRLAGWDRLLAARTVLTYLAMPDEIDLAGLQPLLGNAPVVTRTPSSGPLSIHPLVSHLEVHRYGFRQPVEGTSLVAVDSIDVALIPGLAFDRRGIRLGRGKAYFDELLSRLRPDALRVGVAPWALVVERLPADAHDVRMTHLATEKGLSMVEE